ncbi:hypothetical protein Tco_1295878, partial [Tanacetum coccineum]
ADGAQSSQVPVPLPEDPYEAIRQAYLDGSNTESEPFEDPIDTEIPDMAEVAAMAESAFRKRFRSSYESSSSVSPPDLPSRKRYCGTPELVEDSDDEEDEEIKESMDSDSVSEDAKDEGLTAEDGDPAAEDEGLTAGVEGPGMDDEDYGLDDKSSGIDDKGHSVESDGLGLEEEKEAIPRGQQQAASIIGTTVSTPLGLGYGALRRRELALEEGDVYSTFKTDPEDDMIYIDIPDYPLLAPPVQTPPLPEWTSGLLPISPSHSNVPSPISSPMVPLIVPSPVATPAIAETEGFLTELGAQVEMLGGLISDHAVRLEELPPALFERYYKDIGELFTRSGAIREDIFSQRYRFRSLEYEKERVVVTFGVIWRTVLALEA